MMGKSSSRSRSGNSNSNSKNNKRSSGLKLNGICEILLLFLFGAYLGARFGCWTPPLDVVDNNHLKLKQDAETLQLQVDALRKQLKQQVDDGKDKVDELQRGLDLCLSEADNHIKQKFPDSSSSLAAALSKSIEELPTENNANDDAKTVTDTSITAGTQKTTPPAAFRRTTSQQDNLCSKLYDGNTIPTALSLWTNNVGLIHKASQLLPNDGPYYFHDFTAQLLHLISPRLPRTVKNVPHTWNSVEYAMDVAYKRYKYLSALEQQGAAQTDESDASAPRPLKILVMGGSLLVGRNCRNLVSQFKLQGVRMPLRECNWSHRLGEFINKLFGVGQLVQVTKIAMGGTNTATGAVILEYDLVPEEARDPDIIINAYSTNDMHILTMIEADSGNTTLRDRVFEMTQTFVRQVLKHNPCSHADRPGPPLLLHLDDYLGNEQREIWATTELFQGIQVLANYYGFASMSYADLIRDYVYGDTREYWFSPEGWYPNKKTGSPMDREIHPNMGMHITTMWVAWYNLLNLVTTYCSMEPWDVNAIGDKVMQYNNTHVDSLPKLKGKYWPKGKPKLPPQGIPPILTPKLAIDEISQLWRDQVQQEQEMAKKAGCYNTGDGDSSSSRNHLRCPFSWVGGISLQQNNAKNVEEYFNQYVVKMDGWELKDEGSKLGYIPTTDTTTTEKIMTLEFQFQQPIRVVTLFYMKSYGEKWENSMAKLSVWSLSNNDSDWRMLDQPRNIPGSHAKHTSETYTEEIRLQTEIPASHKIRITVNLASGKTFKIMGVAVCS